METNVISNVFGTKVFNDEVMQEYLPKKTYQALKKTIENGEELTPEMANVVAHGMNGRSQTGPPTIRTGSSL